MKINMSKDELKDFLINADDEQFAKKIDYIHPVDLLEIIHDNQEDAANIIKRLSEEQIASLLDEEDDEKVYDFLKAFSIAKQKIILEEMSNDEIADFLGALDEQEIKEILLNLSNEDQKDITELLSYDPHTAGGIMATEFISIRENKTILKTYEYLQQVADDAEMAYYLYVIDQENHLKGVVSVKDIILSKFDVFISEITNPNVISVNINDDQEEVAAILDKYDFLMIPVVDDNNVIKGVITIDDVLDIIKEETTEDIHRMAGLNEEEKIDGSLSKSLKSRLPWLSVNLFTASLASIVVAHFSSTIEAVVALAAINPIIAGMGGNAGNQSMTIVVRAIALGQLNKDNALRVFIKEFGVGILSGIFLGLFVGIGCYLVYGNYTLGIVAGAAMISNLMIATVSGYLVPVILKKCNIDPALASSIFVTMTTDVLGFFIFLSLATYALQYLI